MFGVNSAIISGNVTDRVTYQETAKKGTPACSFTIVSDRIHPNGNTVSAYVKVNVYGARLVRTCKMFLEKGVYALVEGELMNRSGKFCELTEVRANKIIFSNTKRDAKNIDEAPVVVETDSEAEED